jgi:hypothetical protein
VLAITALACTIISGRIGVGSCSYNHVDGSRALAYEIQPVDVLGFPDAYALFEMHLPAHPLLSHVEATGDGSACHVSDVVSDRQFRSLGICRDFYRHAEVDQRCFVVPYPGQGEIAVALNRKGRDFSAEERMSWSCCAPGALAHRCAVKEAQSSCSPSSSQGRLAPPGDPVSGVGSGEDVPGLLLHGK